MGILPTSLDGVEYRMVHEITKNWKVKFVKRDLSDEVKEPWTAILQDVKNDNADIAMCLQWLQLHRIQNYDYTTYYDHLCLTMLVPKPRRLNEASAIYLAFNVYVWALFCFFFLLTGLLITIFANIGLNKQFTLHDVVFKDFKRTFLEMINLATSHGVDNEPKQKSVNILITR